jgi:hypothetical protein
MLAVSICAFDSIVLKTLRTMGQAVFNAEHTGNQAMLQLQSTYPEIPKDVKLCDIHS